MLIDWFTVGAQVLNFLILVGLMRRFLYHPILRAIDDREARIAAELADAAAQKADGRRERDAFRQKNDDFDTQRAALVSAATAEAATERERLIEQARGAADDMSVKRALALKHDARDLEHALGQRVRREVFAIAREALVDLAEASLEQRMGEVFTRRLGELDEPARAQLAEAIGAGSKPTVVRSAFELPAALRARIQQALDTLCSAEVPLRFETAPALVSGVELVARGHTVGWSIAAYLGALAESVGELLALPDAPLPDAGHAAETADP